MDEIDEYIEGMEREACFGEYYREDGSTCSDGECGACSIADACRNSCVIGYGKY